MNNIGYKRWLAAPAVWAPDGQKLKFLCKPSQLDSELLSYPYCSAFQSALEFQIT